MSHGHMLFSPLTSFLLYPEHPISADFEISVDFEISADFEWLEIRVRAQALQGAALVFKGKGVLLP